MNMLRVLYLGFLLCLCAGCVDTMPVTAVPPTPPIPTPSPTMPKPSATPVPRAIPTATATVVKEEEGAETAVSPSPTLPNSPHLAYSLVTTPVANQQYQLRSWDEQSFISLIADAQNMSRSATTVNHETHPGLASPQFAGYLQTLRQEFLFKYPTSQSVEQINWQLMRDETQSVLSNLSMPLSAKPFVSLLQNKLGAETLQLENMGEWLTQKGFRIVWQKEVMNLLNDHQSQWVIQVESQLDPPHYSVGSLILILTKDPQINYRVTSVREYWLSYNNTSGGGTETVDITDFDQDGQPEIFSVHSGWYHAGCHATLTLYRWNGEQFDDLAAQFGDSIGSYQNSDCQNVWAFSQAGNGHEFLTQTLRGDYFLSVDCQPYVKQVRYEWDGQQFQQVKEEGVLPEKVQTAVCQFLWDAYNDTMINGTPFFIDRLNNWPDDLNRILGEHSKAYYQWKAGVWYAEQGRFDQARALWKPLQESSSTLVSRLAETYTQIYQSPQNAYAACSTAMQIVTDELQQHGYAGRGVLREEFVDIWGFWNPTWHPFDSPPESNICSQREALSTTFAAVNSSDQTTLMAELNQLAIPFLVGQPKGEESPSLLLITLDEDNWYIWVDGDQELSSVPIYADFQSPVLFEIVPFRFGDNDLSYDLILLADELIVRQNESGQPPVKVLGTGNVESYELLNDQEPVAIRVKHLDHAEWDTWVWNEDAQRFFQMELPSQLETIEKLLQQGDFSKAIAAANSETYSATPIDLQPKQVYLLSLAYEMNHDELNAIATYLDLWQTFPESPYAIMARLKLEPIP